MRGLQGHCFRGHLGGRGVQLMHRKTTPLRWRLTNPAMYVPFRDSNNRRDAAPRKWLCCRSRARVRWLVRDFPRCCGRSNAVPTGNLRPLAATASSHAPAHFAADEMRHRPHEYVARLRFPSRGLRVNGARFRQALTKHAFRSAAGGALLRRGRLSYGIRAGARESNGSCDSRPHDGYACATSVEPRTHAASQSR